MVERKTSVEGKAILKKILAQPGNDRCADCKTATHPRWASYNLGVLICIRCSGIHRSLGTHISKVRSIDLDFWTDEQIASLASIGNRKANEYWEAQLPANYIPDESKIMNYVRTKYELKRWVKDGASSKPVTDEDAPLSTIRQGPPKMPPKVRQPASTSVDLLDFGGYSDSNLAPKATPTVSSAPTPTRYSDGRNAHHSHSHHRPHHKPATRTAAPAPVPAPVPAPAQTESRDSLKKSILSLYAKPAAAPAPAPVGRPASSQPVQTSYPSTDPLNNIGALSGLNFGGKPQPNNDPFKSVQPRTTLPSPVPSPVPTTSRVSSAPPQDSKVTAAVETVGDDDELFKNVWA